MKRRGRGALVILALMLAASGAMRLGLGAGEAFARAGTAEPAPASVPDSCPEPPAALLAALSEREAQVLARESAAKERLAALELSELAFTRRLDELATAEADLRAVLAIADEAAEKDLARLTAVYEAMKPAEAAALFATMDPAFAAGFIGRMQPPAAAAVLAGMAPESAYSISVLIAGRNAEAPTQ